eukprot:3044756-Amphidinium_carterae.2
MSNSRGCESTLLQCKKKYVTEALGKHWQGKQLFTGSFFLIRFGCNMLESAVFNMTCAVAATTRALVSPTMKCNSKVEKNGHMQT